MVNDPHGGECRWLRPMPPSPPGSNLTPHLPLPLSMSANLAWRSCSYGKLTMVVPGPPKRKMATAPAPSSVSHAA